ncbi:MAG: Crp/Fnr family transcriptional regulator [Dehalococcoidia bacterium]|nr:Crp/Fnr family transcriptional regulator [Dehalococcoidia bacterium]
MTADVRLLERVPLLAALTPADREVLAAAAGHRRFRRGDIIFHKEDPGHALFIVQDGTVRIYVPGSQGTDLTLAVLGPGDFFGDLSLLDGRPRSASAAAGSDCSLLALERSDFLNLVRSRPDAAMAVLTVVAQRLRETDEMASDLAFLDAGGRVAKKLLELAASHGVPRPDGVRIDVALTQEELASMIGVTRESVNRNLSDFRRAGLVRNEGRRLVIQDAAALRRRCE